MGRIRQGTLFKYFIQCFTLSTCFFISIENVNAIDPRLEALRESFASLRSNCSYSSGFRRTWNNCGQCAGEITVRGMLGDNGCGLTSPIVSWSDGTTFGNVLGGAGEICGQTVSISEVSNCAGADGLRRVLQNMEPGDLIIVRCSGHFDNFYRDIDGGYHILEGQACRVTPVDLNNIEMLDHPAVRLVDGRDCLFDASENIPTRGCRNANLHGPVEFGINNPLPNRVDGRWGRTVDDPFEIPPRPTDCSVGRGCTTKPEFEVPNTIGRGGKLAKCLSRSLACAGVAGEAYSCYQATCRGYDIIDESLGDEYDGDPTMIHFIGAPCIAAGTLIAEGGISLCSIPFGWLWTDGEREEKMRKKAPNYINPWELYPFVKECYKNNVTTPRNQLKPGELPTRGGIYVRNNRYCKFFKDPISGGMVESCR